MTPLEAIRAAMSALSDIPPPPMFASSRMFPAESALRFEHNGRQWVAAHPMFWHQLPTSDGPAAPLESLPLWGIEIVDIDEPSRKQERLEFLDAMAEVMKRSMP